mmetsp:Transcript_8427/g.11077  ORF Transcript_8427/g.11077 Transcript_8427/m.11077 type:complete len:406 (-) Transcript_8427:143-1360(-)
MAPRDFRAARESNIDRTQVEGRPYLPTVTVTVKNDDPGKAMRLGTLLAQMFELNSSFDPSNLQVDSVTGGITNTLYKVSLIHKTFGLDNNDDKTAIKDSILVRIFGAEGMIDRDLETSTFAALSDGGVAPPYYGAFQNGRLEGWMNGMRALERHEMVNWIPQIASALAQLHYSFELPAHLQEFHKEAGLWKQLEEWYAQALGNTYNSEHDQTRANSLNLHLVQDELDWLKTNVIPVNAAVGFCHNDLLCSNILCSNDNDSANQVQLIDFEYGGCNYRSFDIANHWNEYAGGPPDNPHPNYEWFPSTQQQEQFVRAYIDTATTITKDDKNSNATILSVDELLQEIQGFVMVNHFYWGLWAVNQAANEGCDEFDYMMYAINRFGQYWVCKNLVDSSKPDASEHKAGG